MSLKPFALAALLITAFLFAGCTGAPPAGAAAESVDMKEIAFNPATLTVKAGTKVTWTNRDNVIHTVTSDESGGPLNSGNIAAGGKFSYEFKTPGTFKYHCAPHATRGADGNYTGMIGTITVTAA